MATTSSALKPKTTFPTMQSIIAEYFGKEAAAAMPVTKTTNNTSAPVSKPSSVTNSTAPEIGKSYPFTLHRRDEGFLENWMQPNSGNKPNNNVENPTDKNSGASGTESDIDTTDWLSLYRIAADEAASNNYEATLKLLEKYKSSGSEQNNAAYASQLAALEKSKKEQERNETIEYEKLKKYLPEYMQRNGLGALGVADSTLLESKADHINALGNIAGDYNDNKSKYDLAKNETDADILRAYEEGLINAEKDKSSALSENMLKFYDGKYSEQTELAKALAADETTKNKSAEDAYEKAISAIYGKSGIDENVMQSYLNTLFSDMTEGQRQEIADLYTYVSSQKKEESGDSFGDGNTNNTSIINGDENFTGSDGKTYRISGEAAETFNLPATVRDNFESVDGTVIEGYVCFSGKWYPIKTI